MQDWISEIKIVLVIILIRIYLKDIVLQSVLLLVLHSLLDIWQHLWLKQLQGRKLLLLNGCVSGVAGACASFCNTYFMRKLEMTKGIDVFEDSKLKNKIGISKICATSAV